MVKNSNNSSAIWSYLKQYLEKNPKTVQKDSRFDVDGHWKKAIVYLIYICYHVAYFRTKDSL